MEGTNPMSEFIVSFKDVKLTAGQSARVKTALKKAAKKALPITRQPGPPPVKGGPVTGGRGLTGKGSGTGTGHRKDNRQGSDPDCLSGLLPAKDTYMGEIS
jgi:hypothetical protein